jgi:hypothetical protein
MDFGFKAQLSSRYRTRSIAPPKEEAFHLVFAGYRGSAQGDVPLFLDVCEVGRGGAQVNLAHEERILSFRFSSLVIV